MSFLYDACGNNSVTPVLVPNEIDCYEAPACVPCMPMCHDTPKMYCCEIPTFHCCENKKSQPRNSTPPATCCGKNDCCKGKKETPRPSKFHSAQQEHCCFTCNDVCKPVRTKYVVPCYRYEDGRIVNQPTGLMRRACEVAAGIRPRQKPFVESSYAVDSDHEVHQYVSEDERGNCCFHFEKKKNVPHPNACHPYYSRAHYGDGVHAKVVEPLGNGYYKCCQ